MAFLMGQVIFLKMQRIFQLLTFTFFVLLIFVIYSQWSSTIDRRMRLPEIKRDNPYLPLEIFRNKKSNPNRLKLDKYIHLDLKGAPPKAKKFYNSFFNFLKNIQMGVKGVVIEYEDTLPLEGKLANISHRSGYKKSDIELIEKSAKEHEIEIIPLIQTFGHLEWILKLDQFKSYRDDPNMPMVISPCINATYVLLEDLLQQTLNMHPNSNKIHIGCDEVMLKNTNDQCAKTTMSKSERYVTHIRRVVDIVQKIRPGIRILIWDDILRDEQLIKNTKLLNQLKDFVEPVSWNYFPTFDNHYLSLSAWNIYPKFFKNTWAASAFKGGLYRFSMRTNTTHHVLNNRQWLHFMESSIFEEKPFSAIILTGWSRFDHFMPLCDLLPTAYPSLLFSLHVLNTDKVLTDNGNSECDVFLELIGKNRQLCEFIPGFPVWSSVIALSNLFSTIQNRLKMLDTIAPKYNRKHLFVRRFELGSRLSELTRLQKNLETHKQMLNRNLWELYLPNDINEWFELYLTPLEVQINTTLNEFSPVRDITSWPRRPLS